MKRVKKIFKEYMRAIEINAALMYGYRDKLVPYFLIEGIELQL